MKTVLRTKTTTTRRTVGESRGLALLGLVASTLVVPSAVGNDTQSWPPGSEVEVTVPHQDPLDRLSVWICLGEPVGVNNLIGAATDESLCSLVESTTANLEQDIENALFAMPGDGDEDRVLLGILYQHCSYNGCVDNFQKFPTEARFYGTPPGCENGLYYEFPKFRRGWPKGFNDEVSSVDGGYSGCNSTVLFEDANFQGSHYVCTGDCSDLEAVDFNDIASSATFTP